jgi:hypothetical protein
MAGGEAVKLQVFSCCRGRTVLELFMSRIDPFTERRLIRFVEEHRRKSGVLPTLQDFEAAGFPRTQIDQAVRQKVLEQLYVTLTSGTIVKGYKVAQPD